MAPYMAVGGCPGQSLLLDSSDEHHGEEDGGDTRDAFVEEGQARSIRTAELPPQRVPARRTRASPVHLALFAGFVGTAVVLLVMRGGHARGGHAVGIPSDSGRGSETSGLWAWRSNWVPPKIGMLHSPRGPPALWPRAHVANTNTTTVTRTAERRTVTITRTKRTTTQTVTTVLRAATPPPPLALLSWEEAKAKATETLTKLTLQERLSLLHGTPMSNTAVPGYYTGNTAPVPRLGIPALKMQDASSGFRPAQAGENGTTTCFPSLLALAATWDAALVQEVAAAVAREFRGKGANVLLGPGINVHRIARGGRNFEYLSGEDPMLGAVLGSAFVQGVQGQNVMAVIKHFAFNEQENFRNSYNVEVDERTAWEQYYAPFIAAVEAGAGAVMCAYNMVRGQWACENEQLLGVDLRQKMGFQGFVMSDWNAAHSTGAVQRGLDMEMPMGKFFTEPLLRALPPAPKNFEASTSDAAHRILTSIYKLRLDEHPGCEPPCRLERRSNQRTPEHVALARRAAASSVVLLKNSANVLPFDPERVHKIAVLGPAANASDLRFDTAGVQWTGTPYAGGGSGHVAAPKVVTPLEGIRARAAKACRTRLGARHCTEVVASTGHDIVRAKTWLKSGHGKDADVVVVVAAATASENVDRANLLLDDAADTLIHEVAGDKPTVVLLEVSGAVLTPWRDRVDAIAAMFLGGEQAGSAWADVLFGDASPEGKLPVTFPAHETDTIAPMVGPQVVYGEGLQTSYKSPRLQEAAFPFGHGLSYARFEYGKPRFFDTDCPSSALSCVAMTVTNRGKAPGAEIVQVYFHFSPPAKEPRRVLRGFKKTRRLEPGEAVTVTFFPRETDLSVYQVGGAWVPQQNVSMQFGASSADIRRSIVLNPPPPSTSTTTTTTTATTTTATATTTRTTSTRTTTTATVTMTTTTFTTSTSTSSKTRTATTTTVTFTTSTSTMTTTTTTTFTFTTTSSLAGPAPWLYCITLLNPGSYEVELAKVQYQKRAGMFQCTGFTVFSNIDIVLSTPPAPIVRTEVIPGSIRVGYGGPTNNALNIEVFVRVWRRVFADGHYKKYDWTVKLDLDTVFLPERLRIHLVAHPSWTPMYINNCQWELHGPIEVLSNRAMQMYDGGMENCVASKVTNWQTSGEDVFVRDCMDFLKITRVDDFGLLSEIACGENPSPCDSGKVAFHPFKSSPSWLDCWAQAGGQHLFNGINV